MEQFGHKTVVFLSKDEAAKVIEGLASRMTTRYAEDAITFPVIRSEDDGKNYAGEISFSVSVKR